VGGFAAVAGLGAQSGDKSARTDCRRNGRSASELPVARRSSLCAGGTEDLSQGGNLGRLNALSPDEQCGDPILTVAVRKHLEPFALWEGRKHTPRQQPHQAVRLTALLKRRLARFIEARERKAAIHVLRHLDDRIRQAAESYRAHMVAVADSLRQTRVL
jgi:hypothetical protein